MLTYDWLPFLEQWSRDLIEAAQIGDCVLSAKAIESGWIGQPGATEPQLTTLEAYLGYTLPASYRQFLAITNGWHIDADDIHLDLWDTEHVDWFRTTNRDWLDIWEDIYNRDANLDEDPPEVLLSMRTAAQIGTGHDSRVYWLDAGDVTEHGEWWAWMFASG